jgi:hypothetical protein
MFNTLCDNSDFVKNFYKQYSCIYSVEHYKELEKLEFIFYKGVDSFKRKIFLIDLKKLEFNELNRKNNINLILLYLIKCIIFIK